MLENLPDYALTFFFRKAVVIRDADIPLEESFIVDQLIEQEEHERVCRTHGGCCKEYYDKDEW